MFNIEITPPFGHGLGGMSLEEADGFRCRHPQRPSFGLQDAPVLSALPRVDTFHRCHRSCVRELSLLRSGPFTHQYRGNSL